MKAVLSVKTGSPETSPFSILLKNLRDWQGKGIGVFIVSHTQGQAERLKDLFFQYGVEPRLEKTKRFREVLDPSEEGLVLLIGSLSSGFRNPQGGLDDSDRRGNLWREEEAS